MWVCALFSPLAFGPALVSCASADSQLRLVDLLTSAGCHPILEQEAGFGRIRVRKNNATEEPEKEDGCDRGTGLSYQGFDGGGQFRYCRTRKEKASRAEVKPAASLMLSSSFCGSYSADTEDLSRSLAANCRAETS